MARLGDRRTLADGRVQELRRVGHGQQWVTISNPNNHDVALPSGRYTGDSRVNDQTGEIEVRVVVGMGVQWIGTGAQASAGVSTLEEQNVVNAYEAVLGRAPDPGGLINYVNSGLSGIRLAQDLATSQEARSIGVNPANYGVSAVNVDDLTGRDRELYDAWSQYNSGPYYTTDRERMGWVDDAMNLTTYHATQRGFIFDELIQDDQGNNFLVTTITPQANQYATSVGDKLKFIGNKQGRIYRGDFSNADVVNIKLEEPNEYGFQLGIATGSPKEGLIGGEVGEFFTNVVSDQLKFLMDPLGITGPLLFGQKFGEGTLKGGAQLTGADVEDVQRAQQIGQSVAAVATSFIPVIGTFVSAGVQVASDISTATTFGQSRSDAFSNAGKGVLATFATAGLTAGFNNAAMSTQAYANAYGANFATTGSRFAAHSAGLNAATSGLTRLGQSAITGAVQGGLTGLMEEGKWRAAGEGALYGGLSGGVSSAISAGIGSLSSAISGTKIGQTIGYSPSNSYANAINNAVSKGLSSYATSALRYGLDSGFRENVNALVDSGEFSSREEVFSDQAIRSGVLGGIGGFLSASESSKFPTLSDTFSRGGEYTEGGWFEGFGFASEGLKPGYTSEPDYLDPSQTKYYDPQGNLLTGDRISEARVFAPLPTAGQVLFGEDEKFQLSDVFGTGGSDMFKGVVEAFVEGAAYTIAGSFAAGALDPRVGPVTLSPRPYSSPYIQQTYGGFGSLPGTAYASRTRGIPRGSPLLEQIALYGLGNPLPVS